MEQEEYEKEEINWSYIEFIDNQDILDLIEKVRLWDVSWLSKEGVALLDYSKISLWGSILNVIVLTLLLYFLTITNIRNI